MIKGLAKKSLKHFSLPNQYFFDNNTIASLNGQMKVKGGERMESPLLEFDRGRTVKVLRHAERAWEERLLGLANLKPPEIEYWPEEIEQTSRQGERLLFFLGWANRSGMTANEIFTRGVALAREHPELLDPHQPESLWFEPVLTQAVPFGAGNFPKYGNGSVGEEAPIPQNGNRNKPWDTPVDWWRSSLRILREEYNGCPTNIFMGLPRRRGNRIDRLMEAREVVLERLCAFPGIGRKIAQLIGIFFQSVDWKVHWKEWSFVRQIPFIPVDIHLSRAVQDFGCLLKWRKNDFASIATPISDYLCRVCAEERLAHDCVAQAFWNVRARIHAKLPKRAEKQGQYCFLHCPFHGFCMSVTPAMAGGSDRNIRRRRARRFVAWDQAEERNPMILPLLHPAHGNFLDES